MDDVEEGPDPNDVRRHAKRMYSELQYRQRYCRLDFYKPNRKQILFHSCMSTEVMLRAGNQLGKTHAAGAQMSMDMLGRYPDWYVGRRFLNPPKIERPFEFLAWAACDTSSTTRAGAQTKLLGDLSQSDGLGTGLIPLDSFMGKPSMARGISDFVDSFTVRRDTGGVGVGRFKTYEQGRKAFQGEPVDEIWIDEDPGGKPDDDIYGEGLARLTTTKGKILASLTPLLGLSPLRRRFKSREPGTEEILMTIIDCLVSNGGHIPDEDLPAIIARTKASQRMTRLYGADMQGEGAVFETPVDEIKFVQNPSTFPRWWRWMWGLDFRHSGSGESGHPFAAVLGCRDVDTDVIYIVAAVRMRGLAPMQISVMKGNPMWMVPCAWPHDGGRGAGIVSGETVAAVYKRLGLNMRPTHATFPDGGYNFEAGITEMENRFAGKKLLIASHLVEALDEYQGYHRVNGLVNKVDDDILSAIRVLCMDIRYAQEPDRFMRFAGGGMPNPTAQNIDFPLFA